jgi:hypothetical protein
MPQVLVDDTHPGREGDERVTQCRRFEVAEHLVAERDGVGIVEAREEAREERRVGTAAPQGGGDLVEVEIDGECRRRLRRLGAGTVARSEEDPGRKRGQTP